MKNLGTSKLTLTDGTDLAPIGSARVVAPGPTGRRGLLMPNQPQVLIVCRSRSVADNLGELVRGVGMLAEVALTMGFGIARLHRSNFMGLIVEGRELETTAFIEEVRAEGLRPPVFAIAEGDREAGGSALGLDGCVVGLTRRGLAEELRRWLQGLLRRAGVARGGRNPWSVLEGAKP